MFIVLLLLISILLFIIAYFFYAPWIGQKFEVKHCTETPAKTKCDGVDFVPTNRFVLLGHHFASIAGVGPIIGPILGSQFGILPVFLWVVLGGIFFGAVQDFTALLLSIRNEGKTIGGLLEGLIGKLGKNVFLIFTWLTLLLVIGVFCIVIANTFISSPQSGTSSMLFILLAVLFGYLLYVKKIPLLPLTFIFLLGIFFAIFLGTKFPLNLPYNVWIIILLFYILLASTLPVNLLLQPRDYLNSFLLYFLLVIGIIGLLFYRPEIKMDLYTSFYMPNIGYLFPIIFVTVACGAISGFHSIVSSGSSSKQLENELDAQFVGYGGMLIESLLALVALATAAILTPLQFFSNISNPSQIFISGFSTFSQALHFSPEISKTFAALALSSFALTTLDTATRLGRYTLEELANDANSTLKKIFSNRYFSTILTVMLASFFVFNKNGTMSIWTMFGASNQMIAALALIAVTIFLAKKSVSNWFVKIPAFFMFVVTFIAIALQLYENISKSNYLLAGIAFLLLVTSVYMPYTYFFKRAK